MSDVKEEIMEKVAAEADVEIQQEEATSNIQEDGTSEVDDASPSEA